MTSEADAYRMIAPLIGAGIDMTEDQIVYWTTHLVNLDHPDAAEAAIEHLCNTWTRTATPPWAVFLDAYRAAVGRTTMAHRPALPSGRTMPLSEYLVILRQRADKGDGSAATELHNFRRSAIFRSAFPDYPRRHEP